MKIENIIMVVFIILMIICLVYLSIETSINDKMVEEARIDCYKQGGKLFTKSTFRFKETEPICVFRENEEIRLKWNKNK